MGKNLTRLIVVALLVIVAVLAVKLHHARGAQQRAEFDAGLAASRVLSAKFEATGALRAARLSGEVLSQGGCTSGYLFDNQQRTVAPYSVDYLVDLSGMDRSRFRWDARDKVMFVEAPGVTVEPPAVDMSRARSRQSGIFVSRGCGLAMQQQVAGRLKASAGERAGRADFLVRAQTSARTEIARLVRTTLAAAGLGDVAVRVRLANDPRPVDDRQWDRSRPIAEVLADPKFAP